MKKAKLICTKCGYTFEKDILEPGEAKDRQIPTHPIKCPKCGGPVKIK